MDVVVLRGGRRGVGIFIYIAVCVADGFAVF